MSASRESIAAEFHGSCGANPNSESQTGRHRILSFSAKKLDAFSKCRACEDDTAKLETRKPRRRNSPIAVLAPES